MNSPTSPAANSLESFTLAPLSAGDIIDRAVRLYRVHFLVLLRIVLWPNLLAYAGGVAWAVGISNFSLDRGDWRMVLSFVLVAAGAVLYLVGKAAFLLLVGGASRALVFHFFDGAPLLARDVYRAVRQRFWSLVGATIFIAFMLLGALVLAYTVFSFALVIYIALATWLLSGLPEGVLALIHSICGGTLLSALLLFLLLVYARIVYVPPVMMVEGVGVFHAVGRSFKLAGGELRKIAALLLFNFYVVWSLYWLLVIPLGWYGYWSGLDIMPFSSETPLWFSVVQQTLTQISDILLAPIVLLGFTLLYIDSRIRKEGFDVEMFANRVLPPAPWVAPQVTPPAPPPIVEPPPPEPAAAPPPFASLPPTAEDAETIDVATLTPHDDREPARSFARAEPLEELTEVVNIAPPPIVRTINAQPGPQPGSQPGPQLGAQFEPRTNVTAVAPPPPVKTDAAQRYCPQCGSGAESGARFCLVCGEIF